MTNNVYFVSGIDTDCGKTYITGLIANFLKNSGVNVITQKLIQTGCKGISDDIIEHRKLMHEPLFEIDKQGLTCSYVLEFPSSPHLAAQKANIVIDINVLQQASNKLAQTYDVVLTEGAGGLMVPINQDYLILDFIKQNNLPLILVSSSKLGSINHTLLSLEACKQNNIDLKILVYNVFPNDNDDIIKDSYEIIKKALAAKFNNSVLIIQTSDIINGKLNFKNGRFSI